MVQHHKRHSFDTHWVSKDRRNQFTVDLNYVTVFSLLLRHGFLKPRKSLNAFAANYQFEFSIVYFIVRIGNAFTKQDFSCVLL